jgi:hypothetical protein
MVGMKRIDAAMAKKMVALWVVAVVVFAAPHPLWGTIWDPILHRPLFLIVVPLLIACIPLLLPAGDGERIAAPVRRTKGRGELWGNLVLGVVLALFLVMALVAVNDPSTPKKGGSNAGLNFCVGFLLLLTLAAVWKSVRELRRAV